MVQVRAVIALLLHRFWRFATRFAVRLRGVGSRFLIRLATSFQAALPYFTDLGIAFNNSVTLARPCAFSAWISSSDFL